MLNLKAEGSDLYESNVKAMIAAGWELAAHTIHHLDLTNWTPHSCRKKWPARGRSCGANTASRCENFCYPAGRFDDTVIAAVEAAGYVGATTEIPGYAEPRRALRTGPLRDPRLHRRRRARRRTCARAEVT